MYTTTITRNTVKFFKLLSPEGDLFIRADSIIAIAEAQNSKGSDMVKTRIWVDGQEEPFNVMESIDVVVSAFGFESCE